MNIPNLAFRHHAVRLANCASVSWVSGFTISSGADCAKSREPIVMRAPVEMPQTSSFVFLLSIASKPLYCSVFGTSFDSLPQFSYLTRLPYRFGSHSPRNPRQCNTKGPVPVRPGMIACLLSILMPITDEMEMVVKTSCTCQQLILQATVEPKYRALIGITTESLFGQSIHVVLPAKTAIGLWIAENGVRLSALRNVESATMAHGGAKESVVLQCQLNGAISAHRKPLNGPSFSR